MMSAVLAAILLACAGVAAATSETGGATDTADASGEEPTIDEDIEGDFAPFMIVVEHTDGWRCSGSLVSLRTALSSAWCARGRNSGGAARELWALAASVVAPAQSEKDPTPSARAMRLHGTRRISRVAVAIGADAEMGEGPEARSDSWRGSGMDMAVMELEKPFGNAAHARPILMAMTSEECTPAARECHVTRALPQPHSRRARLLIVSATLAAPEVCAASKHWSVARERALCLVGPELCVNDWGAGVVCGGKLCGVLSRSVRSAGVSPSNSLGQASKVTQLGPRCGDRHAAQSVARWRRFLHCAHTLRACGSGRDCADLCIERRLLDEAESESEAEVRERTETEEPPPPPRTRTTHVPPPDTYEPEQFTFTDYPVPSRTTTAPTPAAPVPVCSPVARTTTPTPAPRKPGARRPPPPPPPLPPPRLDDTPVHHSRMAFEFEPNRADFKVRL